MSVLTLELLEACPYFKLHSLEAIHEIGDLRWREVVSEYRLHIFQRPLIGGQSDRLQIRLFCLSATRELLEDGKGLVKGAAKFPDCYPSILTGLS